MDLKCIDLNNKCRQKQLLKVLAQDPKLTTDRYVL
jgi:hypothetical protein